MQSFIKAKDNRYEKLVIKYELLVRIALIRDIEGAISYYKKTGNGTATLAMISSVHIKAVLNGMYLKVIQSEAEYQYLELVGEKKALPSLPVADWLRRARNFVAAESSKAIVAITTHTRNLVKQTLKESLVASDSIPVTAKNMKAKVAQFSQKRAVKIARTELIGAQNKGSLVGAQSTSLPLDKVWLATPGVRTRDTHQEASGQRVDINQAFTIGGDSCQYPADPALSAAERINCRCTMLYKPKAKFIQSSLDL